VRGDILRTSNLFSILKSKKNYILAIFSAIIECLIIYSSNNSFILLNENRVLYISSTLSQVVATLFGLSITGYVFLDGKLKNDVEEDESLIDIVGDLKAKYKSKILSTGILSCLGIFLCIINMCLSANNFITIFVFNNSLVITFFSIVKIILFVKKIIDPQKIQKESSSGKIQLMEKLEEESESISEKNNNDKVSIEDFLITYNNIESKISNLVSSSVKINGKYNNMHQNLKILESGKKIDMKLLEKINILRRYRNYLVHGRDMIVDEKVYYLAKKIKFPTGKIYEDAFYTLELLKTVDKYTLISGNYYYYYIRENSITNAKFNPRIFDLIEIVEKFHKTTYENYPGLKEAADCRKMYAYFSVLNSILLEDEFKNNRYYAQIINYFKGNYKAILKNKYINRNRKLSVILIKLNIDLYRKVLMKYKNRIAGN